MRAVVTLLGLGLLALAGCLSHDVPAPDGGAPLACAAGGSACPALAGFTVTCEDGACVARSPAGETRVDCAGDGRYSTDLRFDARNCGACGVVCPGMVVCVDGACACGAGEVRCGGSCVSTASDRLHCGGCGHACAVGEGCARGVCVACAADRAICDGRCVDLSNDTANCGGCRQACPAGAQCLRGTCTCLGGGRRCGDRCVDLSNDPANCGGCGQACPAGAVCRARVCACPDGSPLCGGRCLDLSNDPANCGRCNQSCGPGGTCSGGRCVCPAARANCGGTCVDIRSDPEHCGACFNSCRGTCQAGRCYSCAAGSICGEACVDRMTDRAHCGACGVACAEADWCEGGRCVACRPGTSACGGPWCTDITNAASNCGACGVVCPYRFDCVAGRCVEPCDVSTSLAHSDWNCGACGVTCGAGTLCVEGRCASASPRLKAPISTTLVTSPRPWFRWELPAGADGVRVEVCATRSCDRVEASWEAAGDRLRAPTALAPGVHHWRAFARRGGRFDAMPSVVWEFVVPGGATVLAEGEGVPVLRDLNGDGVGDRAEPVTSGCTNISRCVDVRYGRPATGVAPMDQRLVGPPRTETIDVNSFPYLLAAWFGSDLNGDGFGDLVAEISILEVYLHRYGAHVQMRLHGGSSEGVFAEGAVIRAWESSSISGYRLEIAAIGDRDGDGYGDIAVWRHESPSNYIEQLGGRTGVRGGSYGWGSFTPSWIAVGDFNADGRSDVVAGGASGSAALSLGAARSPLLVESTEVRWCSGPGATPFTRFGTSVGDVNDDGYDDLTAAWYDGATVIRRSLYLGGPDGLSSARCTPLP